MRSTLSAKDTLALTKRWKKPQQWTSSFESKNFPFIGLGFELLGRKKLILAANVADAVVAVVVAIVVANVVAVVVNVVAAVAVAAVVAIVDAAVDDVWQISSKHSYLLLLGHSK